MKLWSLTICLLVAACHQQAASPRIADTTIVHPDTLSEAPVAEAAQPWKPGGADSDFGVGISNTLDSLKANPRYKDLFPKKGTS